MPANPYARADRRVRRARLRTEGATVAAARLLPALAGVGVVLLLDDAFYPFLGAMPDVWRVGAWGLVLRVSLLVTAVLCLATYGDTIRGPDRGIADLHPLRADEWLRARLVAIALARLDVLALGAALIAPLVADPPVFALAAVCVLGAWFAGIGAGVGVNLAAPAVAVAPSAAPLLDAVRGANPRLQAALLWAPGVALALAGVAVMGGVWGADRLVDGDGLGGLALVAPWAAGAAGLFAAARNASAVARLPALLGEIDAAWAAAEPPEDARAVYMEWAARWAPAALRADVLRALRHLWRAERVWVSASWGVAVVGVVSAFGDAPGQALGVALVGVGALGAVSTRLAATDPAWLDAMLPSRGRAAGRAFAVFAVVQGVVMPVALAAAAAHGVGVALAAFGRLELTAAALAALGAAVAERWRGRGALVYVPVATLVAALGGAG